MGTTLDAMTVAEAARIMREATKDKSYQLLPMGNEAAEYLRIKRKRLTDSSYRDYERGLDKLARYFPDLELKDFEPPIGTQRLEEFLDHQYGDGAPRNYNKNLSILRDFFKAAIMRGKLHGDPTRAIESAKKRAVYRTTFSPDQSRAIIANAGDLRDRIALRLLLHYGLRKGTLAAVQFSHFDHGRRRLTTFAKGGKVRELPIPDPKFWDDLERHILDIGAQPHWYLLCRQREYRVPVGAPDKDGRRQTAVKRVEYFHDKPVLGHWQHDWWYKRLEAAGIVAEGTTRGQKMHKARHTAGQRILDATGNLKAVQKLLDHSTIATTGDIYADWDIDQLAHTLKGVLVDEDDSVPGV